ncbi:hypothetical protein BT63DRAFT_422429 [Microthyrium microscopicum]|uniref:Hamartin-domain-containing protein n=1 Tax=Microthyrium microscopicum TaxID=703497 RepID=A0A6A6UK62_9PEZI|nr:hypothetical protein BT63DRAFT_422429 [Microthyrium microscopicum]
MPGSLKDTLRVLQDTFAEPSVTSHPLPDELERTIERFVESRPQIDDHDSQKIHEELLYIFNKYVSGNTEKHGPFVATLRLLRPAICGEKRLDEWWKLIIRPTVDSLGHKRDTIEDAREFLLGVLVFDVEDDPTGEKAEISMEFTRKLVDAYLARTKLPSGDNVVSPEDEFLAHELEGVLVAFGRKNPKELLVAIDELFVQRDLRLQALSLLSSFVRLQPPHLHLVLETSLIQHLHTCLLLDNSTTVVDLALTILIMFIPHITTTLVDDLPRLFLIYARILCWNKYNDDSATRAAQSEASESEYASDSETRQSLHFDPHWDVVEASIDGSQSIPPKANYLFTFLYGLFPLNFMNFIRKPRRYLKMKAYPRADDLDLHQGLIRIRTEPHRIHHKLHPNFFLTTAEDELSDNHWVKSDPADLVSQCLGLSNAIAMNLGDPGPPPISKLPALPRKSRSQKSRILLNPGDEETLGHGNDFRPSNSNRNTMSTTMTGTTANNHESLRMPPRQLSHTSLLDAMARSPKSGSPTNRYISGDENIDSPVDTRPHTPRFDHGKSSASAPPSPPRSVAASHSAPKVPTLQSFAQTLSRFPLPSSSPTGGEQYNSSILQREVMLLKNDLNFERFQKQRYIEQIGNMQRKHMGDVGVEADTHTLMNKNRSLKARLTKADERYEQLKKEVAASRSQAKKFEEQLTAKLKTYREDEKQLQMEVENLKHELGLAREECNALQKLVSAGEKRDSNGREQLGAMESDVEEVNRLRNNIFDLESKIQGYEQRDFDFERTHEEHSILQSELECARMKVASADSERDRLRRQYEQKIMTLEANARNSQLTAQAGSGTLPNSVQQMIDSALSAQQSKFLQLKRTYTTLHRRYMELELRNTELENAIAKPRPGSVLSLTRYADDSALPGLMRQDSFGQSTNVPRSRSVRRHDFSAAEPLLEDTASSSGHSSMYSSVHSYPSERPRTEGHMMNGMVANPTMPLRGPSRDTFRQDRDINSAFEQSLKSDFAGSPTESLADTLKVGAITRAQTEPGKTEVRSYGRGGAGNVKKPKDKESSTKKSGFRGLKGIM